MLASFAAVVLIVSDVTILWLLWRARGKPLPRRWEWLRRVPIVGRLCQKFEASVPSGL